jgi:hypothetical protein
VIDKLLISKPGKSSLFHDDWDRLTFLEVIAEMADQHQVDVFACTLMSSH